MISFDALLYIGWGLFLYFLFLIDFDSQPSVDEEASEPSTPASVTGHPDLPDRTAQSPPVAGDGGETG